MTSTVSKWWQKLSTVRWASRIAKDVQQECWEKIRGKAAVLGPQEATGYVHKQAVNLVHRQVDLLVRAHPSIDGRAASELIAKASQRLAARMMKRLNKQSRRISKAA